MVKTNIKYINVKQLVVIIVPVWYSYSEIVMGRGVPWPSIFLGEKMKSGQNCWVMMNSSFKRAKVAILITMLGYMIQKLSAALAVEAMQ